MADYFLSQSDQDAENSPSLPKDNPSISQQPATGTTIEFTPRQLDPTSQDTQAAATQSNVEITPKEHANSTEEPPNKPSGNAVTQSDDGNTPKDPAEPAPVSCPYSPPTPNAMDPSTLSTRIATQDLPFGGSEWLDRTYPSPSQAGSSTESGTQESVALQGGNITTNALGSEPELPQINPETGFRIGITIGRTEFPDSEAVLDWTPEKVSQNARSGELQSTPSRAGDYTLDVAAGRAENMIIVAASNDVEEHEPPVNHAESRLPDMGIRSSQSGMEALEGTAEKAMEALKSSNVVSRVMKPVAPSATVAQSTSRVISTPRTEVPDSDSDEESFDTTPNNLITNEPPLPTETAKIAENASTVDSALKAGQEDTVMRGGLDDIDLHGNGTNAQPAALNRDGNTQEGSETQSGGSWPSISTQVVPVQQEMPSSRRTVAVAEHKPPPINDDEQASEFTDSTTDIEPRIRRVNKRLDNDSQEIPDTQPMRTNSQTASGAPEKTRSEAQEAGNSEPLHPAHDSKVPQVAKSVTEPSQPEADPEPMLPRVQLLPASVAQKRSAPVNDEDSNLPEGSQSPSTSVPGSKEPIASMDAEELPDAPSSSNSIQEPSTVADIPPSPSVPTSRVLSSPSKAIVPSSSRGKQAAAERSSSQDILLAELKAIKISSIQTRNAALEAEIASKRTKLEEVTKELSAPAAETVKKHIKLLHDYNDIRDVGQGLVGMIADNRGVRIGELYDEFGVGLKD